MDVDEMFVKMSSSVLPCNQVHDSSHALYHNTFVSAITEEAFSELGAKRKDKHDCCFQPNERTMLWMKCNSLFCS